MPHLSYPSFLLAWGGFLLLFFVCVLFSLSFFLTMGWAPGGQELGHNRPPPLLALPSHALPGAVGCSAFICKTTFCKGSLGRGCWCQGPTEGGREERVLAGARPIPTLLPLELGTPPAFLHPKSGLCVQPRPEPLSCWAWCVELQWSLRTGDWNRGWERT